MDIELKSARDSSRSLQDGTVRVLIADGDPIVRRALAGYLDQDPKLILAGVAADGREAITNAVPGRVDVVLMDLRMPTLDGLAAARRITRTSPAIKVLMLACTDDEQAMIDSLDSGAAGFLLKTTTPQALLDAIRAVAGGITVLSPSPARTLIEHAGGPAPEVEAPPEALSLTGRERSILRLLCSGASNSEIADELYLSESTVKTNVSTVMTKLGVPSRLKAVVRAHEWRLLDGQDRGRAAS